MKKIKITVVAVTVVALVFFTGCDKYHRDRYTGTWSFVTVLNSFFFDPNPENWYNNWDTIYYVGKICKESGSNS